MSFDAPVYKVPQAQLLTTALPDSPNTHTTTRFIAGGLAGSFSMWFLMRATPLFNAYHARNNRLVHVLFPTFVIAGTASNVLWNRNRENVLADRWTPTFTVCTLEPSESSIEEQEAQLRGFAKKYKFDSLE